MTGPSAPLFKSVRVAKKRDWGRTVRVVAIAVAALSILLVAVGLGLWKYANSRIKTVELPALEDDLAGQPLQGTLTVLLVGADSREGLTDEQLERLGTEDVGTDLTDTIMIVQVSPAREQVAIVSFPRDLRVAYEGEPVKLNSIKSRGGADALVATVQDYTGVEIDHYVEVDLAGFLRLTDAIGGVEVCTENGLVDAYAGANIPPGCHELDGEQAVGFVRARQASDEFGSGDFGRIARQQYFIRQAMDKLTSAGTLLNPFKLKGLIDAVAAAITTDRDLGARDMLRLANSLRDLTPEQLETRSVPGYWQSPFVYAHPERAEALFQALREGGPMPDVGQDEVEDLAPADVELEILNGVGTSGLAAEVEQWLEDRGFVVSSVGNADSFDVATTVIRHAAGERAKADLVAGAFPGASVEEGEVPPGVDVVVVVGADWVDAHGSGQDASARDRATEPAGGAAPAAVD
ncbi:MAG: LCP family protein [Actinobacteria bacterium]|nr:LCP family protein [Actinomycetota bacterium]